ncbi:MAG: TIGR04053 family radical SAM/SPASM domain-containing protein [Acidobacteriota bacterium]
MTGHPGGRPHRAVRGEPAFMRAVDFSVSPFLVIWETTQACALVCRHCRASAQPGRDPRELTTDEGRRIIDEVAEMGTPLLVLSGGDPVNRPDLLDLIRHGKSRSLRMATIPAATDCLTRDLVQDLKGAGLDQMAVSLDFPRAEQHDAFRGVPGSFAKTMQAVEWAHEVGLPLQVNTTVCGDTAPYLEEMAQFVQGLGIVFWEVFFLVPMGRGTLLTGLSASECERLFEVIYGLQKKGDFIVKVTEAPHYRRHVAQREMKETGQSPRPDGQAKMPDRLTQSEGPGHTVGRAPRGVNSGKGFLFVSHVGEIFPSGFLPIAVGDVRHMSLSQAYRDTELFKKLRQPELLKGRCGRCEFRDICGGSRSRAFGLTGDPFETDPWCSYEPSLRER